MNKYQKELVFWSLALVSALALLMVRSKTALTGPLYIGQIHTDLNLNNVFDKSLVSSELLVTNATRLVSAPPEMARQPGEARLVKYFRQLYPYMGPLSFKTMVKLYSSLDCWYETVMSEFGAVPSTDYTVNRLSTLERVDKNRNLVWARLFGGSVCDCQRVALKQCRYSGNVFSPQQLVDCESYLGLRVDIKTKRLLQTAYDSDNATKNFTRDAISHVGMSGLKGFPDGAWYEGLTFPGEYGVPKFCKTSSSEIQPGLTYRNQIGKTGPLLIPTSSEPWFNNNLCSTTAPACPDGFQCVSVTSTGEFGPKTTLDTCLRKGVFIEGFRESFPTDLVDDCVPGFPSSLCSTVSPAHFRGFYTFPLRGCGIWYTVGKSVACNTKLGFLLSPIGEGGCGLSLVDLMALRGTSSAIEQNINSQVSRVATIIQFGSVSATASPVWPALTIADLKIHGYSGTIQSSPSLARKEAEKLITYWYVNGYTGIENGIVNGTNYNYEKYFPIGTHYSYAFRFDNLILSWLTIKGLDSLQILLEPQNVVLGIRPAYAFQILSAKPKSEQGLTTSVFKDVDIRSCKATYSIGPDLDLDHYIRYGYLDSLKVRSPALIDPNIMTMKAEIKSFTP